MKILLVDDSATVRATYGKLLSSYGHEVLTAATAEDALRIARERKPNLAIVDFHLGGSSGDELIYELQRNPLTMNIMVVMLSGDKDALRPALEAGAIDLIYKGEDPAVFLKRIAAIGRVVAAQQKLTNQLVDLLQKVTDAVNVGVVLQDKRGVHPFNKTISGLAVQHGGLSQFTDESYVSREEKLEVQSILIDKSERLILVREK